MSEPRLWSQSDSSWLLDGERIRVTAVAGDEVHLVAGILDEASAWLESRGLPVWPRPLPVDWIQAGMSLGTCYLAWDGPTPVGTFTLQRTDPAFWGERGDEPAGYALYLHRLAVLRSHRGLGRALLELAEVLSQRSGASCLRLDCVAANPAIRRYYEAAGFKHLGDIDVTRGGPWTASLYEKKLAATTALPGRRPTRPREVRP